MFVCYPDNRSVQLLHRDLITKLTNSCMEHRIRSNFLCCYVFLWITDINYQWSQPMINDWESHVQLALLGFTNLKRHCFLATHNCSYGIYWVVDDSPISTLACSKSASSSGWLQVMASRSSSSPGLASLSCSATAPSPPTAALYMSTACGENAGSGSRDDATCWQIHVSHLMVDLYVDQCSATKCIIDSRYFRKNWIWNNFTTEIPAC